MGKRKETTLKKGDQMENVPAKTEATKAVAIPTTTPDTVLAPHIGTDDLVVAKILPVHYISEKAKGKTKTAEPGEFRDTVENKLFGSTEHPFDFLPIHMLTFWAVYDMTEGGQGKFMTTMPVTPANENFAREEVIGGQKIKRIKTYECYALIPEEIKTGAAFPYVLSFRVTSSRAGKTLLTQMYVKNKMAGKLPWSVVCENALTEESNDHGDFFVQHTKPKRAASAEEQAEAQKWYEMINAGKVKKDDSDLHGGTGAEEMKQANTEQF